MVKPISSIQKTLRQLRQQGSICGIVEHFNQYARIRQDLFGFIDIVALLPDRGIVAIQCCTTDHASHKAKILANEVAPEWLKSGGKIEIWSWRKLKIKRGGVAMRWTPRVEEITKEDF